MVYWQWMFILLWLKSKNHSGVATKVGCQDNCLCLPASYISNKTHTNPQVHNDELVYMWVYRCLVHVPSSRRSLGGLPILIHNLLTVSPDLRHTLNHALGPYRAHLVETFSGSNPRWSSTSSRKNRFGTTPDRPWDWNCCIHGPHEDHLM